MRLEAAKVRIFPEQMKEKNCYSFQELTFSKDKNLIRKDIRDVFFASHPPAP